jgi:hypothetical protein
MQSDLFHWIQISFIPNIINAICNFPFTDCHVDGKDQNFCNNYLFLYLSCGSRIAQSV